MSQLPKKYSKEDIQKMQIKFNAKDYSPSWYRKHFIDMMLYIKWVNGQKD